MEAKELVTSLNPNGTVRELASGANKVFRVMEDNQSTIVKVYPVSSRERRERHALEALVNTASAPRIIDHGLDGDSAWMKMTDGGRWSVASLPKNLDVVEAAGNVLRQIHASTGEITNLSSGIDADYVLSHYRSTVERLGRFRRRFGMDQVVLDRALELEPPLATAPTLSHTKPLLTKFVVNDESEVTLVDWEWATLAPPEWDLTLAVWQVAGRIGEDAAASFRSGYGAELPESRYRPWVAYHAAMMMLEAAEVREGRLGDLQYLVNDFTEAVMGT